MTIDEITKRLHVSKRTVYLRLKERNITPDALRDEQRQLTSEGMSIIASLFPEKTFSDVFENNSETAENPENVGLETQIPKENEDDQGIVNSKNVLTETKNTEMETENAILKAENAALKREVELLREMLDDTRQQRDQYQAETGRLLAALEAAQTMQQRLLPEGRGSSWLARLFSRK